MSNDLFKDLKEMHAKYGVHERIKTMSKDQLSNFMMFRYNCLEEEMGELNYALKTRDKAEIVDALIDLTVFAIGTLDAFLIDGQLAWDEVLKANMNKTPGIKPERPNQFGFPDLIKPSDWIAPTHKNNTGLLWAQKKY